MEVSNFPKNILSNFSDTRWNTNIEALIILKASLVVTFYLLPTIHNNSLTCSPKQYKCIISIEKGRKKMKNCK